MAIVGPKFGTQKGHCKYIKRGASVIMKVFLPIFNFICGKSKIELYTMGCANSIEWFITSKACE